MNTNNLKFFTGCTACLALLCSLTLGGCGGAENDISALECFAGSCDEEGGEDGRDEHHDPDYADPDNIWTTIPEDCDNHGIMGDFDCNSETIGRTLYEEAYHVIFVCEEPGIWQPHPELSNCSDYRANNSGNGNGTDFYGSSDSKGYSSSSTKTSNPLCGDLWCGHDHDKTVNTGFDDGNKTSGIWIDFGDYEKGGISVINVYEGTEKCAGLCGNVYLDNSLYSTPYAGLYFNLVNEKRDGADISSWKGFCMTGKISSETIVELVHQQGEKVAPFVAYLEPISTSAKISWNDFLQEQKEGQISLGRDEYLSQVAAIKIYWKSASTLSIPFEITSVGTYGSCP